MITREKVTKTHNYLEVTGITCDICGKEEHGIVGVAATEKVPCGRFERRERNTEENMIDEHSMINEWPLSKVADLCNNCAFDIQQIIDRLARGAGGGGCRRPTEIGD